MKTQTNKLIQFIGTFFLFGIFIVMSIIFYSAYFVENKSILVTINTINEADSEAFIIMPLVFILGLFSVYQSFINYFKDGGSNSHLT